MNQLMETLFNLLEPPQSSGAEARAVNASKDAVQAVEQRMTYEELDKFWNAIADVENGGYLDSFTLGFRLGVQLTLEGLKPIVE